MNLSWIRALSAEYSRCTRCPRLCESRTNVVFGAGSVTAEILYVGGAPGETEDEAGEPFVGPAGRLLLQLFEKVWPADDQLEALRGLDDEEYFQRLEDFIRGKVFITNTVLCRPDDDRTPSVQELKNCTERLHQTIYAIDPLLIIAGGKVAASHLLGKSVNILEKRGELLDVSITSPVTGREVRYPVLPVLDCGFLLRKGDTSLVKEKKGHTYETMGDFAFALEILKTHKRLVKS